MVRDVQEHGSLFGVELQGATEQSEGGRKVGTVLFNNTF